MYEVLLFFEQVTNDEIYIYFVYWNKGVWWLQITILQCQHPWLEQSWRAQRRVMPCCGRAGWEHSHGSLNPLRSSHLAWRCWRRWITKWWYRKHFSVHCPSPHWSWTHPVWSGSEDPRKRSGSDNTRRWGRSDRQHRMQQFWRRPCWRSRSCWTDLIRICWPLVSSRWSSHRSILQRVCGRSCLRRKDPGKHHSRRS